MYSLSEIKIIINNCNTVEEIIKVCKIFKSISNQIKNIKQLQFIALKRIIEI